MTNILFFHPMIRNYRVALFSELNKTYTVHFFFTDFVANNFQSDFQHISSEVTESIKLAGVSDYTFLFRPKIFQKTYVLLKAVSRLVRGPEEIIILTNFLSPISFVLFLMCILLRKKVIFYDLNWIYPIEVFKARLYLPFFKWLVKKQKYIISAGEVHKKFLMENGASKSNIIVAPTVSEKCKHSMSDLRKTGIAKRLELGVNDKVVYLYIGRLVAYKGLDILLDAYEKARNHDTALIIAGGGELEEKVKMRATQIGADVHYVGVVPSAMRWIYYELADVVVLPSIFRKNEAVYCEGWGLIINEAFELGKPVLCTDACGATHEILRDEFDDLVVKEGSVTSLSAAMEVLFLDQEKRNLLGNKAKETIKKYNPSIQQAAFKKIINKVIQLERISV